MYNLPLSSDGATGAHTGQHYNQFFQSTDTIHPTADQGKDDFYDTDLGFFVQDTWKWRPNFTVNVGLRYDLQMVPQPPDPNQNPFAAIYTSKIYLDKSNVAPRLGISYQPTKNLVIRGGYGLFFGKQQTRRITIRAVRTARFNSNPSATSPTCPTPELFRVRPALLCVRRFSRMFSSRCPVRHCLPLQELRERQSLKSLHQPRRQR